jgi:hypothetical protein
VRETERFVNEGRGWECRRCRDEDSKVHEGDAPEASPSSTEGAPSSSEGAPSSTNALARFFREGESEEREPRLSSSALARWKDESRRALVCTRCGAEEDLPE